MFVYSNINQRHGKELKIKCKRSDERILRKKKEVGENLFVNIEELRKKYERNNTNEEHFVKILFIARGMKSIGHRQSEVLLRLISM